MKLAPLPVLLGLVMCSAIRAQVPTANQKIVIEVVDLQGAVHLPDSAKRQLVASLMHSEYAEESDCIAGVEDKVSRAETEGWPDRENQGYIGFPDPGRRVLDQRSRILDHATRCPSRRFPS